MINICSPISVNEATGHSQSKILVARKKGIIEGLLLSNIFGKELNKNDALIKKEFLPALLLKITQRIMVKVAFICCTNDVFQEQTKSNRDFFHNSRFQIKLSISSRSTVSKVSVFVYRKFSTRDCSRKH